MRNNYNTIQYRLCVGIIPEDDNTYSAIALNLPGCGSCGKTKKEVINNIKDAGIGLIQSYMTTKSKIPWKNLIELEILKNIIEISWLLLEV